jgi:DNA-binding NtrC family response regulator
MVRILVVDNEPDLRDDLEWAARGAGREVVLAQNAEEAIGMIEQVAFDVVVTDLQMETKEAGLNVLKAAKEKDVYTQVLVCTAYGSAQVSINAMRLGAFDYIERNAPGTDVLEMIKSKIALALEFREAKLNASTSR